MLRWFLMTALLGGGFTPGFAQTPPPAFEAAAIKPNKSGSGSSSWHTRTGFLTMTNVSLRTCILAAYRLKDQQLSGPGWLESEMFDITARAAGPVGDDLLMPMLQNLLIERFHLATHTESRQVSGYALVVGKGGLKIKPSPEGGHSSTHSERGRLGAENVSMAKLAEALGRQLRALVIDETGLPGVYSLKVEWTPEEPQPGEARNPTGDASALLAALAEQTGLKVEGRKVPLELLVVDHADRVPTEN